jgi:Coenzyme PQQ synthesis protein D (PqqD)
MLALNAVPRLRPGVLLESTSEENYLYDSDSQSYALLDNDVAIEIARLCDGANNFGVICERISLLYEAPSERIQEDVLAMLVSLADEGFIQIHGDAQKS